MRSVCSFGRVHTPVHVRCVMAVEDESRLLVGRSRRQVRLRCAMPAANGLRADGAGVQPLDAVTNRVRSSASASKPTGSQCFARSAIRPRTGAARMTQ
ncbi:hypothetical protein ABID95_003094 [Streptomyces atratus]